MKKLLSLFLFVSIYLLQFELNAQCNSNTFQKFYGGSGNERAHSIIKTEEGGYAIVGETDSYGAGGNDFFVLKLDINGVTQWTKTYGGSAKEDGANIGIIQTKDGGYLIHGYTESFGAGSTFDSYVVRLDNSGAILWEKRVDGSLYESFRDIHELSSGAIIITGNTNSLSSGNHDFHVLKLSSAGNIIWSKMYGANGFDQSIGLTIDAVGNLIISGNTDSYGVGTSESLIIKTDSNGTILWEKVIGGSNYDFTYNTIVLNDGNILTVGGTEFGSGGRDIVVYKLSSFGNLIWAKAFGGSQDDYGINLRQKNNNEIIISANTLSYGNGQQMLLFSIDSVGNVNWSKTYGAALTDEFERWGLPMELTTDGGIIFTGTTENYGANGQDIYLIKANGCGESYCNEQNISLTVTNPPIATLNSNLSVLNGLTLLNTNTLTSTVSFNSTLLCDSIVLSNQEIVNESENFLLYPNPASNIFYIENANNDLNNNRIQIFDITGKLVNGYTVEIENRRVKIDIHNLSVGVYLIDFLNNKGLIKRNKIIKIE